ncbi:MAG: hypothetical protein H7338_23600 [Candidatus Sericytochromatia bacterium]|nr:hypothetical protein [Candidatus Sericytochromatia bacterium]
MSIAQHLPAPLHRLAVQTVYGALNVLRPMPLPATGATLSLNACFHTERLDDDAVFATLLAWCRDFRAITGVGAWLCVMTPEGSMIRDRLARSGFEAERYGERVRALADVAEIGYHGHYVTADGQPAAGGRFTIEAAQDQIRAEISWLRELDLAPQIYTGGWWVVSPELLTALAAEGIRLDCSTRGQQSGTFGDRYPGAIPGVGERFELVPPVVEIASLPYFAMPWARYRRLVASGIPDLGDRPQWAVLPLHDYSLVGIPRDDLDIVRQLSRLPYVRWVTASEAIYPNAPEWRADAVVTPG